MVLFLFTRCVLVANSIINNHTYLIVDARFATLTEEENGNLLGKKDSKKTNFYGICLFYFKLCSVKCAILKINGVNLFSSPWHYIVTSIKGWLVTMTPEGLVMNTIYTHTSYIDLSMCQNVCYTRGLLYCFCLYCSKDQSHHSCDPFWGKRHQERS